LSSIILAIYLNVEPLYTPTALITSPTLTYFPKYIAHKSLTSKKFQGNSLEAIQNALMSYVDGIEVDVRLSKDGIPFLYHAETLEEATNGFGKPEDYKWEQLKLLSYKNNNQKLLTLTDLFNLVGSQKFIFLDVKSDKIFNHEFCSKITELINKYHIEERVFVESFNPFFLALMRLNSRNILLVYDYTTNSQAGDEEIQTQFDRIPWILKQPFFQKQIRRIIRPDMLGIRFNTPIKLIKPLIDHGYPIMIWTVDDKQIAEDFFNLGVKSIQTNKPLELIKTQESRPFIIYDAGGTISKPSLIIHAKNIYDIIGAIKKAKLNNKKITIAGRKHSMGGQSILNDSIHLDMMEISKVVYNPVTQTITIGAGATWKKVQNVLDQYNRSIKVMQSDNIFTLGGTLSVNAHGWQVNAPPISSTVLSLKVITADGIIRDINKHTEPELFQAVLGGYGLFGVIVEAELITVENPQVIFHAKFMNYKDFINNFKIYITENSDAELAYGRLSVEKNHLFEEAGLFWYEKTNKEKLTKIQPESLIALKRGIFRISQYFNLGKKIRWNIEKLYAQKMSIKSPISRNSAMNTDIHIL
jgi:glycerophosphoryl diester phosphodiesterase